MGYGSQCLQTQPAKEEVTGNLCSSLLLKHCPGSGSEESNLFQEIREEPALMNQKYPCF